MSMARLTLCLCCPSLPITCFVSFMNFLPPEAPCSHVVDLAKAEILENPNASRGMREMAAIKEDWSAQTVQRCSKNMA